MEEKLWPLKSKSLGVTMLAPDHHHGISSVHTRLIFDTTVPQLFHWQEL